MPVASPFVPKFLKFFQIRYLEPRNLLTVPDRAYKAHYLKQWDPFFENVDRPLGTKLSCESMLRDSLFGIQKPAKSAAGSCRLSIAGLNLITLITLKYSTQILAYVIFTS